MRAVATSSAPTKGARCVTQRHSPAPYVNLQLGLQQNGAKRNNQEGSDWGRGCAEQSWSMLGQIFVRLGSLVTMLTLLNVGVDEVLMCKKITLIHVT